MQIVSSLMNHNIWYVFRDDKTEIKVEIKGKLILSEIELTKSEIKYFKTNVLKNG